MATLRDLGEIEVLRRLTTERAVAPGVAVGPGDDAAVLEPTAGMQLVATTDAFVEDLHYLPAWATPERVGARLAAANLSDLAAMAATPRWALLSIGARPESEAEDLVALQHGLQGALARCGATIVGGNLTSVDGAAWYSLTLLGEVEPGRAWLRSGARPGDLIAVTGFPGRAGAGLRLAQRLGARARSPEWQRLLDAWLEPEPRVALALELSQTRGVSAAIDISDGFAGVLAQLCEASGVGAELMAEAWPVDPDLERAAGALGVESEALQLGPSDDYELVLAIDPAKRTACEAVAAELAVPLAFFGQFSAARGVLAIREASGETRPLEMRGYDSFVPEV